MTPFSGCPSLFLQDYQATYCVASGKNSAGAILAGLQSRAFLKSDINHWLLLWTLLGKCVFLFSQIVNKKGSAGRNLGIQNIPVTDRRHRFFRLKHNFRLKIHFTLDESMIQLLTSEKEIGIFFELGHYHYLAFIMFCLNSWKPFGGCAWRLLNKAISLWFVLAAAPLLVRIQWLKRLLLIWVWLQCFPFEKNHNN